MRSMEQVISPGHRDPVRELAGHQRKRSGPECETMSDVRYEIDRLDRFLVHLIAERQTYIEAAARIKPQRDQVRDQARIEDVVSKVLASAQRAGLSKHIAEPVWRCLIERSIAHEFDTFDANQS